MISVLTFNIRFGLAQDGPNGFEFRKHSLKTLINQYPVDFLGVQEVNDFQFDFLRQVWPKGNCIGRRVPAPETWQNNIIFYRSDWRCIYRDHFFLSPTPDIPSRFRLSRWPRQCTVGMFERENKRVACINTHFDFDSGVQADSARLILERIRTLPAEVPVLLFGDFNAAPDSACHQIFTGKRSDRPEGARIFTDAFSSPYPATYHGFTGEPKGDHIDWILFSGDVTPDNAAVLQQTFDGRYPSDHFPLLAGFHLP